MEEEGVGTPSHIKKTKEGIINLCISGADVKHVDEESWSIVIYERGVVREMHA